MSAWMPTQVGIQAPTFAISSVSTALKRKSSAPAPPYSSGMARPSMPWAPASSQNSRGSDLSWMYFSAFGMTDRSIQVRADSRNASWSSS